jgi:hypothetical protein
MDPNSWHRMIYVLFTTFEKAPYWFHTKENTACPCRFRGVRAPFSLHFESLLL